DCDTSKGMMASRGISFISDNGPAGSKATLHIGDKTVEGFSAATWTKALIDAGYPNYKATDATVALTPEQVAVLTNAESTPAQRLAAVNEARKAADPAVANLTA